MENVRNAWNLGLIYCKTHCSIVNELSEEASSSLPLATLNITLSNINYIVMKLEFKD